MERRSPGKQTAHPGLPDAAKRLIRATVIVPLFHHSRFCQQSQAAQAAFLMNDAFLQTKKKTLFSVFLSEYWYRGWDSNPQAR